MRHRQLDRSRVRLHRHVQIAPFPHPVVALVDRQRRNHPQQARPVREDADHPGPPLQFLVEWLHLIGRSNLLPVFRRDAQTGPCFFQFLLQPACQCRLGWSPPVGRVACRCNRLGPGARREDGPQIVRQLPLPSVGYQRQQIPGHMHLTSLPPGTLEVLPNRGAQSFVVVTRYQLDSAGASHSVSATSTASTSRCPSPRTPRTMSTPWLTTLPSIGTCSYRASTIR